MRKDTVTTDRKKAEANKLKLILERRRKDNSSVTQDHIAEKLEVTQGLIGQWLSGKTNIPDKRLMALGDLLNFDPLSIRPSLESYRAAASDCPMDELINICRELGIEAQGAKALQALVDVYSTKDGKED